MRTFFNIVKKMISGNDIRPLGRWNIDYCNIKTNNKIDLSNEDHCGTCGQYAISKLSSENKKRKSHSCIQKNMKIRMISIVSFDIDLSKSNQLFQN